MQASRSPFELTRLRHSLLSLSLLSGAVGFAQQGGVGLDAMGEIVLIAENGNRTVIAHHDHCNEIRGTPDQQMLACIVSRGVDDHGYRPQFQIELYHSDGSKLALEPGGAIREWHFWNDDQQVAISYSASDGHVWDALYGADSGKLVAHLEEPANLSQLPQWAKSRTQIDDESVPMDTESQEMRNRWMNKVLREIATIQPGMHRSDLATLFREDGGINPIDRQFRYVFKECAMIKIDVSFRGSDGSERSGGETPDDVIESISRPYLQWPIMD